MRDNWFWRGYEAVRMSYTAIRGWERQNRDERRARERDMRVMAQQRPAEKSMAADERR
jgi:hypothetical protein